MSNIFKLKIQNKNAKKSIKSKDIILSWDNQTKKMTNAMTNFSNFNS